MNEFQAREVNDRSTFIYLAFAASVLFASILTLHNIASLHSGNWEHLRFSLPQILFVSTPVFLFISLLLMAPALVLKDKLLRVYAFTISYLAILVWIYSNFIVLDFGLLDGRLWDFASLNRNIYAEIIALPVSWFILGFATINRPKICLYFFVFLNLALLGPTAYAFVADLKNTGLARPSNKDALFRFSRQQNILIVLMDSFQSDFFADLLKKQPALSNALYGFKFFPDTAGVARTTYLTMPSIHSGASYMPRNSIREIYDREIRKGSFLNSLAAAAHEVTMVNPINTVSVSCPAKIKLCVSAEEVFHTNRQMHLLETAHLLDLSLFRAVPLFAKESIYNQEFWWIAPTLRSFSSPVSQQQNRIILGNRLLDTLSERGAVDADRPVTKFIHLMNTHLPYVLGTDCQVRHKNRQTRSAAIIQARCALDAFVRLLDFLKQHKIYDQSMIFLIADTGAGLASSYAPPSSGAAGWRRLVGRANPLFLVKAPGARGPLRTIYSSIQISDINATVCAYAEGCMATTGISVFDAGLAPARTRVYWHYNWSGSYWARDEIPNIQRRTIHGAIWDRHSWDY